MSGDWVDTETAAKILGISPGALHGRAKAHNHADELAHRKVANADRGHPGVRLEFRRSDLLAMREHDRATAVYPPATLAALGALIGYGGRAEDKSGLVAAKLHAKSTMWDRTTRQSISNGLKQLEDDALVDRLVVGKRTLMVELTPLGREWVKEHLAGIDRYLPSRNAKTLTHPASGSLREDRHAASVEAAAGKALDGDLNRIDRKAMSARNWNGTPPASEVRVTRVPPAAPPPITDDDVAAAEGAGLIEPASPPPPSTPEPEPDRGAPVALPPLPDLGTQLVVRGLMLDESGKVCVVLRNGVRSWLAYVVTDPDAQPAGVPTG